MAVSYQHDRQELITGLIEVTYADMTSGTAYSVREFEENGHRMMGLTTPLDNDCMFSAIAAT